MVNRIPASSVKMKTFSALKILEGAHQRYPGCKRNHWTKRTHTMQVLRVSSSIDLDFILHMIYGLRLWWYKFEEGMQLLCWVFCFCTLYDIYFCWGSQCFMANFMQFILFNAQIQIVDFYKYTYFNWLCVFGSLLLL